MRKLILALVIASLAPAGLAMAQTRINGSRTIEGTVNYCADAGASDTYACNLSPAIAGYVAGARYSFKANTANTGPATINFNSLGAKTIKKMVSAITTDLSDNDIRAGQIVDMFYDGTNMQMISQLGNAPSASGYATIQDEGTPLTQRLTVNITGSGAACADDAGNNRTNCVISGGGGGGTTFTAVTKVAADSPYTATAGDFVLCNAAAGPITITLPAASVGATQTILVKKIDSSANACTIGRSGSDTIDGATTQVLNSQYTAVGAQADGSAAWSLF